MLAERIETGGELPGLDRAWSKAVTDAHAAADLEHQTAERSERESRHGKRKVDSEQIALVAVLLEQLVACDEELAGDAQLLFFVELDCAGNDDVIFQLVAEFADAGKLAGGMEGDVDVAFSFALLEVESALAADGDRLAFSDRDGDFAQPPAQTDRRNRKAGAAGRDEFAGAEIIGDGELGLVEFRNLERASAEQYPLLSGFPEPELGAVVTRQTRGDLAGEVETVLADRSFETARNRSEEHTSELQS